MNSRLDLEKAIVSGCFDADAFDLLLETLDTTWFYYSSIASIFDTAKKMNLNNQAVDRITLCNAIDETLKNDFYDIATYESYSSWHIKEHVETLKRLWTLDQIKKESLKTIQAMEENPLELNSVLSSYQDFLFSLTEDNKTKIQTPQEIILTIGEELEQIKQGKKLGYSWGLPDLDSCTGGILQGRLYVVAGLKKTGKTLFLLFVIKELLKDGHSVFFSSLEERQKSVWMHLLCNHFAIDSMDFYKKQFAQERMSQIAYAISEIGNYKLTIDDESSPTTSILYSKIRKAVKKGAKVIALDFIQRTRGDHAAKKHEQMEEMAIMLANSARDYNVPIIVLSQAQSEVEHTGKPTIGNLKDAQAIAENADHILFLNDPNRNEINVFSTKEKEPKLLDLHLWQRHGISSIKIPIYAQLQFGHFACAEKKREEQENA